MASTEAAIGRDLRRLFDGGSVTGLGEAQLLDHVARRDELTESAFEAILTRHGPTVLACCRRVLGDSTAAEDAFQATFLVLFRRAGSIQVADSLAPWLLHVARLAAIKARESETRRRVRERRAARPEATPPEETTFDLRELVRAEVNRLPAKYRDPVHLCYFEGRTYDDAAAALGWPAGTVRGRLSRARDLLRKRLMRRGVGITPAAMAAVLGSGGEARAEIPMALREATLAVLTRGAVGEAVVLLAAAVGRGLAMATVFKAAAVVLAVVTLISVGAGIAVLAGSDGEPSREQEPPRAEIAARVPSVDRYGDPLPRGAIARLGTTRFRLDHVESVCFTPDGKTLLTVGWGEARIWDITTGRLVRSIDVGEELLSRDGQTRFAAYPGPQPVVLSRNGQTLFAARPGLLRAIEFSTGRERSRVKTDPEIRPRQLAVSRDGQSLAATFVQVGAGLRGHPRARQPRARPAVVLFRVDTLAERRRIAGDFDLSTDLAFSPDGRILALAGFEVDMANPNWAEPKAASIRLYDVVGGAELRRIAFEGFRITSLAFAPDGQTLAAGVGDGSVRLYDLVRGQERLPKLVVPATENDYAARMGVHEPGVGAAACLAFAPDGSLLASGPINHGYGGGLFRFPPIRLWDVAAAREVRRFAGHPMGTSSLAFAPDGKTLASSGEEPEARIWDVATGREVDHRAGHLVGIAALAVSPSDGTVFTSGGADGLVFHWDPSDGRLLERVDVKPGMVHTLAVSPDGRTLFVLDPWDQPLLWDVAGRKELRRLAKDQNDRRSLLVAFSPDGRTVGGAPWVWDVATGRRLGSLSKPGLWSKPLYTADGRRMLTVDPGGVQVWDLATGSSVLRPIPGPMYGVSAFSPDGRLVAVGPPDDFRRVRNLADQLARPIRIWEIASGKEVAALLGHTGPSAGLAFSPDGRMIASVSGTWPTQKDPGLRIWDVASGKPLRRFKNAPGGAQAIAYLPDGRSIVTGSQDGTALVWDISDLADRRPPELPDAKMLETLWSDLASDDARRAHRASWSLSLEGAVPFLHDRLHPAGAKEPTTGPEFLRSLRAIAALERIGTPPARAVLEALGRGDPAAPTTKDATDALLRLSRRKSRPPAGATTR